MLNIKIQIMKIAIQTIVGKRMLWIFVLIFLGVSSLKAASFYQEEQENDYNEYRGVVVDNRGNGIASAYLTVEETNISTVTNSEGVFSLKVPKDMENNSVHVAAMRYQSSTVPLDYLKNPGTKITLEESAEELSEVAIYTSEDPRELVRSMLRKRGDNYFNQLTEMTAFYRESIKKRRHNVSLSEAVVRIQKQPYTSLSRDNISIIKARKSADYEKLDTLALKLRGGPFNTLNIDLMKNPQFLFDEDALYAYEFTFDEPARINNRYLYVVNFREYQEREPWYYGTLYIDAETQTLVKASFGLNVDNRRQAARLFVKKKPGGTKVYPIDVKYEIDYRERGGKWYYGHGQAELEFVVNWKRRLFNSRYTVNSEIAITHWEKDTEKRRNRDFINERIVMSDDVSGFADTAFWGDNNIIEPDKSIENAIEKIRSNLDIE